MSTPLVIENNEYMVLIFKKQTQTVAPPVTVVPVQQQPVVAPPVVGQGSLSNWTSGQPNNRPQADQDFLNSALKG